MRLVSLILILALLVFSQSPLGIGPGAQIAVLDWYSATASGCTPVDTFPAHMCVGGGAASRPQGDTYYFSGWAADGTIFGTANDYISKTCGGNIGLLKIGAFSWASPTAARIDEVNCMTDFGTSVGGSDSPPGWNSKCTSANTTANCSGGWKSRSPFALDGKLYLPVMRQYGNPSFFDVTIIRSDDGGATWRNPYTIAHGGSAVSGGDAPKCGAVTTALPCTDVSYPGSIMWPASPLGDIGFFQFGQDGNLASSGDSCDPSAWVCAAFGDGSIGRVARADLPSLDVTKWQYVASLNTSHVPTFTSVLTNRLNKTITSGLVVSWGPALPFTGNPVFSGALPSSNVDSRRPHGMTSAPSFIKEFKQYLVASYQYSPPSERMSLYASPTPFGPYNIISNKTTSIGFAAVALGVNPIVISTNPPAVQLTVITDEKSHVGAPAGVPYFQHWNFSLGRQPYGNGEVATYTDVGSYRLNSGWVFGSGIKHGEFVMPRWAFDFNDTASITTSDAYPFVTNLAGGEAVLTPCYIDAIMACGVTGTKGITPLSGGGVQLVNGFTASLQSSISSTNYTASGYGNLNAPSAFQGNGTYSVVGIFRQDANVSNRGYWATGELATASGNGGISLDINFQNHLALEWGNLAEHRYWSVSTFNPTLGSWYYMATVVDSSVPGPNGPPDPSTQLWVGIGGVLVNVLAGVPRTITGGAPTRTPAVTAGPLIIGSLTTPLSSAGNNSASFGGILVYDRALSRIEVERDYQAFRIAMAQRGITIE